MLILLLAPLSNVVSFGIVIVPCKFTQQGIIMRHYKSHFIKKVPTKKRTTSRNTGRRSISPWEIPGTPSSEF